jgi:predicted nucleic acid-binding protein
MCPTYGELLANGYRNRWGQSRIKRLQTHLHRLVVIPYNESVVVTWAQMHAKLSGHLHKGGTNDLWTAACAISIDPCMPIVTNNLTEFQTISTEFLRLQIVHPDM